MQSCLSRSKKSFISNRWKWILGASWTVQCCDQVQRSLLLSANSIKSLNSNIQFLFRRPIVHIHWASQEILHLTTLTPHTYFSFSSFTAASWFAVSSCWCFSIADFCKLSIHEDFYFRGVLFFSSSVRALFIIISHGIHNLWITEIVRKETAHSPSFSPTTATSIFSQSDLNCQTFTYKAELNYHTSYWKKLRW